MREVGKAESALGSDAFLRAVARPVLAAVEHVATGAALVFDRDLRVVDVGGPVAARYGWEPDHMRGGLLADALPDGDFARIADHLDAALRGEQTTAELPTADNGSLFACDFSPIRIDEGRVVGGLVLARERGDAAVADGVAQPRGLSRRERTVLALAAQGLTTAEIADELVLAPSTIESHIRRACARIGARNRSHAITLALATGQLELDALALGVARRDVAADDDGEAAGVFEQSPLPIIAVDMEGRIASVNPAYERVVGRSRPDLIGRDVFELVHPDDLDVARGAFEDLSSGEEPELVDITARHLYANGDWRWMAWAGARSADGRTLFAIGREIVGTGELEQRAHRPAGAVLAEVAMHAPLCLFVKDTDSRYVYANHYADETFGTGEGLVGLQDRDFLPPDVAEKLLTADQRALREGQVVHRELVVDRHGRSRDFLTAKFAIRDPAGRPQAIAGIAVEVPAERH